jgi:hypothetical protein
MTKSIVSPFVAACCAAVAQAQPCQPAWTVPPGVHAGARLLEAIATHDFQGSPALWVGGQNVVYRIQNGTPTLLTPAANTHTWRLRSLNHLGQQILFACTDRGLYQWTETAWTRLSAAHTWDVASYDSGGGAQLYYCTINQVRRIGDGTAIGTVAPGNCGPTALAVFPGEGGVPQLHFGGFFRNISPAGAPGDINCVARWNGAAWFPLGSGLTEGTSFCRSGVMNLVVHDDGSGPKLFAGGAFQSAGGQPASSIAAWDGQQWSAVGAYDPQNQGVVNLLPIQDGVGTALYACGDFQSLGGVPASCMARWDGSTWSAPFPDISNSGALTISGVARFENAWYAVGEFFEAGTADNVGVAKLECICPDFDNDGVIGIGDLSVVLAGYGSRGANLAGDVDRDWSVDLGDLSLLLARFGETCP